MQSGQPPMFTVPTATTVPTGRSTGSLQVSEVSPLRAAGFLLIVTVALPLTMVPLLVGGLTNVPPTGMCGGVLVHALQADALRAPPSLNRNCTKRKVLRAHVN